MSDSEFDRSVSARPTGRWEIDRFRTFLAVHRAGSVTHAAADLGLSQPAVTAQIQALERDLGKPLFVRRARGVSPTAAGDRLAGQIGPHLDALDAVLGVEEFGADPMRRTVYLGGPADVTALLVLPALADLVAAGQPVRVAFGLPEQLTDDLLAGRCDLAVLTMRPRVRGISAMPLFDEEFILVGAPDWRERLPAQRRGAGLPELLSELPLIAYAEDLQIIRRYWQTVFDRRPTVPAALVVPDLRAVLGAVIAGAGVSVLPRYLVADALRRKAVVALHNPELPPLNTLYLATRTGAATRPHLKAVRETLFAAAKHW